MLRESSTFRQNALTKMLSSWLQHLVNSLIYSGMQTRYLGLSSPLFSVCVLSGVLLFVTPWKEPSRLLTPRDYSTKNTGVGCHFLLQGNLHNPGSKPKSPVALALAGGFFTTEPPGDSFPSITTIQLISKSYEYNLCISLSKPSPLSLFMFHDLLFWFRIFWFAKWGSYPRILIIPCDGKENSSTSTSVHVFSFFLHFYNFTFYNVFNMSILNINYKYKCI